MAFMGHSFIALAISFGSLGKATALGKAFSKDSSPKTATPSGKAAVGCSSRGCQSCGDERPTRPQGV